MASFLLGGLLSPTEKYIIEFDEEYMLFKTTLKKFSEGKDVIFFTLIKEDAGSIIKELQK
jgi:hypothetical protein